MANTEENMEERILQAAETTFMKQGFAKTTTAQIAKVAGCNQALVHYYYRTKDNLFNKVFEGKINFIFSNINTLIYSESEMSLEDMICKMVEVHYDFLAENSSIVPFIIMEFVSNPKRFRKMVETNIHKFRSILFDKVEDELEKEIKKGNIAKITIIQLIQDIVSLDVATFIAHNMFQQAFNLSDETMSKMRQDRKEEILRVIKARLRP